MTMAFVLNDYRLTDQVLAFVLIVNLPNIFDDFWIGPDIQGTDTSRTKVQSISKV